MLKIRKEQSDELAKIAIKRFEDSMVVHIKEFFPKYFEIMGKPIIRNVIQYGIDRAEDYDFTTERDVSLYISLMIMLGSNFDVDPQLPWAGRILTDESIQDSIARIDRLYDTAMDYLDRVSGLESQYYKRALVNVRDYPFNELSQTGVSNIERKAMSQLQKIWPQKYESIDSLTERLFINSGIEIANNYNFTSERGVGLYIALMFMLGSGFNKDPQFPWAAAVLNDKSTADQATRIDRLYNEAMALLKKCLA